jgi:uncharacterized cupredoxin-like copper-binding protein
MATLLVLKTAIAAVALNYGVHVGSSVAYASVCVPQSVWDLARTMASTASPVCSMLLATMQITQNNFAVVLTTTVTALVAGALAPT